MSEQLAYLNNDFIPVSALSLSVDDLGFVQGTCVSERLRTFQGTLFRLEEHLERLGNSLEILGLSLEQPLSWIGEIARQLVDHNRRLLLEQDDLGLSLFVTPGLPALGRPTIGLHTYPLPFGQWSSHYRRGQALTETGIRQVPASCWPPALKCRSRMHYYLADQRADKMDPGSRAILLDQEGLVSEASTANIVMYQQDLGLVSPPLHKILPGVSLCVLMELASSLAIPVQYRDIQLAELASADEILLCSTSPCVWPVTRLNGQPIRGSRERTVFHRLLAAWNDLVGLDIAAQAERFAHRV